LELPRRGLTWSGLQKNTTIINFNCTKIRVPVRSAVITQIVPAYRYSLTISNLNPSLSPDPKVKSTCDPNLSLDSYLKLHSGKLL